MLVGGVQVRDAMAHLPVCRCGLEGVSFGRELEGSSQREERKASPIFKWGLQFRHSWGPCIRMPGPPTLYVLTSWSCFH